MRFVERDNAILKWINGFGFASADQIMRFMGIQKSACYARLKKLVSGGYLIHEYVLHGMPGVYRPTALGALTASDTLAPINSIKLSLFKHDLALVDLALYLSLEYEGVFTPNRRFKNEYAELSKELPSSIADGYLSLKDNDKSLIAVELELQAKAKSRLIVAMESHIENSFVSEVWYYCADDRLYLQLSNACASYEGIKVFSLEDYFANHNPHLIEKNSA